MTRHRSRTLRVFSFPILVVAVALCVPVALPAAAADPETPPASAEKGKRVNIATPRCPIIDCHLGPWTVVTATRLWANHDKTSEVVATLQRGFRVEGIAARTVTTYLPHCRFVKETEGRRAGCAEPDCKPVKFSPGDEFFLRERLGAATTLIESGDAEFEVVDTLSQVTLPSGKIELVRGYRCDRELDAKVWVQVRLPDGTTGWAYREHFDGTIDWSQGGVIHVPGR